MDNSTNSTNSLSSTTNSNSSSTSSTPSTPELNSIHNTWTISNFSKLKPTETIHSDHFGSGLPEFSLYLLPEYIDEGYDVWKSFVSIYLQLHCGERSFEKFPVSFEFSILNETGKKIYMKSGSAKFDPLVKSLGFPKFISRNNLLNYLTSDDQLIVHCEATFAAPKFFYPILEPKSQNQAQLSLNTNLYPDLEEEFSKLLIEEQKEELDVNQNPIELQNPEESTKKKKKKSKNFGKLIKNLLTTSSPSMMKGSYQLSKKLGKSNNNESYKLIDEDEDLI